MTEKQYTGRDVAAVIPTFRRPQKLRNLLESLAGQTVAIGRVIVVDGDDGEKCARAVVGEFASRLDVDYRLCLPPSQIRQRNAGLARLRESDRLVAFLDDDLVLELEALENIIGLWNTVEPETAGIGFNITNLGAQARRFYHKLLPFLAPRPGTVLSSGASIPWLNIESNIRTQWLGGGYTIWRRAVLDEFSHEIVDTRWAAAEDLLFSYPIGKKYPLFACADAKVRHEHIYDQVPPRRVHRYRGRKSTVFLLYFVSSHPELSMVGCLFRASRSALSNAIYGVVTGNRPRLDLARGQAEGIMVGVRYMFGLADLRKELEWEG